jgi:hypothetical protein
VRGEGGRGKRGTNRTYLSLRWGRDGPRQLADGGTEPVAGAGGDGDAR